MTTTIVRPVHVNGTSYTYASPAEALRQVDRWVAEALYYGRRQDGTWTFDVSHMGTSYHVHAYDSGEQVDCVVRDRHGVVRVWSSDEIRDCLRRRWPEG